MGIDPRSRHGSEVHPHVETLRIQFLPQGGHRPLGETEDFTPLFRIEQLEVPHMPVGNNHDVAVGVRESVENNKSARAPEKDEILGAVLGLLQAAENAPPSPNPLGGPCPLP